MKKYMPGFVPIDFNLAGKIILPLGIILALVKIASYLTDWFNVPSILIFIGIGVTVISLYLVFVVPKK